MKVSSHVWPTSHEGSCMYHEGSTHDAFSDGKVMPIATQSKVVRSWLEALWYGTSKSSSFYSDGIQVVRMSRTITGTCLV